MKCKCPNSYSLGRADYEVHITNSPHQIFRPSYGTVVHKHVVSLVLPEIETGVTSLEIRTHLDIESFVLSGEHDSTYIEKKPV